MWVCLVHWFNVGSNVAKDNNGKLSIVISALITLSLSLALAIWWLMRDNGDEPETISHVQKVSLSAYAVDLSIKDKAFLFETRGSVVSAPARASEKNQAMDRLMAGRGMAPDDFSVLMRRLHADGAQDELTRNFAVQHLGLYVQRRIRLGEYDPKSREALEIRSTLEAAAGETHSTVAGPAFKALAELAEVDPAVVEGGLDARLVSCVGAASANVPTRVIAVQLCGARRLAAARPALEAILADPKTGTVLKLAASRAMYTLATHPANSQFPIPNPQSPILNSQFSIP